MAQYISIFTSCSHGIARCCISFIVFLSTNLVSSLPVPCLPVSVSLSAGMCPFYTRGLSTKTMTARSLGWWNHMLMRFLCCLTVTRARIPNGDLHLISNFNLALEYAEALRFVVLYNFLCFTLWEMDNVSIKAENNEEDEKRTGELKRIFFKLKKKSLQIQVSSGQ